MAGPVGWTLPGKDKDTVTGSNKKSYTYRDAGVDIDAGARLVDAIKPLAKSTRRTGSEVDLGGFGALFDLKATGYTDPILVAGTDGVGTKLKVAIDAGLHETVGVDLVAMCVNDLIVQGAEPLFFLDYFATGKLSVDHGASVVGGIAEGCRQAGCALIGGETAEMPGMYAAGDYDLAGFAVGAVERGGLLPLATMGPGDVLLGLASSGIHSNGYSLVRRIVGDLGLDYGAPAPFDATLSLGEALLTPTRIYVKSLLPVIRHGRIKALSHITGGGFVENMPRVLPSHLSAGIDASTWPLPAVFQWLMEAGNIAPAEMARTFNCGIGMVAVVAEKDADGVTAALREAGEAVYTIGGLAGHAGDKPGIVVTGAAGTWSAPENWQASAEAQT